MEMCGSIWRQDSKGPDPWCLTGVSLWQGLSEAKCGKMFPECLDRGKSDLDERMVSVMNDEG